MAKQTAASRRYMGRVAQLPCVVCGAEPVEVHHKLGAGMGLRASDYETIPLCSTHHRNGPKGVAIHSGTKTWEDNFGTQDYWVEQTQRKLGYATPDN